MALADVLDLIGFVPQTAFQGQLRGPCPVHHSTSPHSRTFSANLTRHVSRCFKCGSSGNQLDLYAAITGLPVFAAALALCQELHQDVPWIDHS